MGAIFDQTPISYDRTEIHAPVAGIAKQAADQTIATTTLTNSTDLKFDVRANTDYLFEFFLIHQSAASTTGLKVAVTVPASPTYVAYRTEISVTDSANGTDNVESQTFTASAGTHTAANQIGAAANSLAIVKGVLSNGTTAGKLQLQFAGDAAANITLKKGSYGRLWT